MKSREFKLNLALPEDKVVPLNIARLQRYIKEISPGYNPSSSMRRRMQHRAVVGRVTGGFPGRGSK